MHLVFVASPFGSDAVGDMSGGKVKRELVSLAQGLRPLKS